LIEYLKNEVREKHILKTFRKNIDPSDFPTRKKIIAGIMEHLEGQLPEEITSQSPEKYAEDYEEIIQAFVHSRTKLESILKRL